MTTVPYSKFITCNHRELVFSSIKACAAKVDTADCSERVDDVTPHKSNHGTAGPPRPILPIEPMSRLISRRHLAAAATLRRSPAAAAFASRWLPSHPAPFSCGDPVPRKAYPHQWRSRVLLRGAARWFDDSNLLCGRSNSLTPWFRFQGRSGFVAVMFFLGDLRLICYCSILLWLRIIWLYLGGHW
jgi:hypothetical protein